MERQRGMELEESEDGQKEARMLCMVKWPGNCLYGGMAKRAVSGKPFELDCVDTMKRPPSPSFSKVCDSEEWIMECVVERIMTPSCPKPWNP